MVPDNTTGLNLRRIGLRQERVAMQKAAINLDCHPALASLTPGAEARSKPARDICSEGASFALINVTDEDLQESEKTLHRHLHLRDAHSNQSRA